MTNQHFCVRTNTICIILRFQPFHCRGTYSCHHGTLQWIAAIFRQCSTDKILISSTGVVLRWSRGAPTSPTPIRLLPPQIQKLADRSDVISEVPKCSKIQIFRGSAPVPAAPPGELTELPGSLSEGQGAHCLLSRTPPPLSGLRASFLRVSGFNPLQSWQPY